MIEHGTTWFAAVFLVCAVEAGALRNNEFAELTLEQLSNVRIACVSRGTQGLADTAASMRAIADGEIRPSRVTGLPQALPNPQVASADNSLLLTAASLQLAALSSSDGESLERRIKAAFLYKFADFVEWPESALPAPPPAAPLVIGVMHDDALAAELAETTANRMAAGRRVAVRRLKEGDPPGTVHILFVGRAGNARMASLLKPYAGQPVLVVTESEGALPPGGIINFLTASGRVRFEVALDNAKKRGLRLSSRLLTVAQAVRTSGGQP